MKALHDVPAPAKLNLFLHVVGKRPDGYHLLQSVFVLIDWADKLHFDRRDDGQLRRHDLGPKLPDDDLCLRAARLLQQYSGCAFGADIHIDKRLPAGAGMGGGSSDAATVLLALNRLWGLKLPRKNLLELGLRLGADVPFFLGGQNAFVEGIGEVLHPLELPELQFAVLKPSASIATSQIFSSQLLQRSESMAIVAGFPAHADLGKSFDPYDGRNDLQKAAEAACPEVAQALSMLNKKFGNSRMTGSGSAVFAVVGGKDGDKGILSQAMATILRDAPEGWLGEICRSLSRHPLVGWVEDS
ncbi:MAG: 4-(cytidine 5'-diphospho)-2-C-methyl-D-erythritol kinase [Paucibacter sp.]|nr:4-(cytidine 5'-diphospho)-2-C-methyl-D-erythritol kinase [Roseateles sp.]